MIIARTHSTKLDNPSDVDEPLLRASKNEYVFGRAAPSVNQIRTLYPYCRVLEYSIWRNVQLSTTQAWDAYCVAQAIDPEQGYCHKAGVRHTFVDGVTWYVMNVGNAAYRTWVYDKVGDLLEGVFFDSAPVFISPPPLYGCEVDLTVWQQSIDGLSGVLTTTEYTGTGDLYRQRCREMFEGLQSALATRFSGYDVRAFPNFGDVTFAALTDADTIAVLAASSLVMLEHCFTYYGGQPVQGDLQPMVDTEITTRLDTVKALLATHDVMLYSNIYGPVGPGYTQAEKDRAKIGCAVLNLLVWSYGLIVQYRVGTSTAQHVNIWEGNELIKTAINRLGPTAGDYEIVGGHGGVKGTLLRRKFVNGRVMTYIRKAGQAGSESINVAVPSSRVMSAQGSEGPPLTTISLSLGEAVILVSPATSYINPNGDVGTNTFSGAPGGSHHLTVGGEDNEMGQHDGLTQGVLDSNLLTGDTIGEKEQWNLTPPPSDLLATQSAVVRFSGETIGFNGAGGYISFPVEVRKADNSLVGATTLVMPNNESGIVSGVDTTFYDYFKVFACAPIEGLNLTAADIEGLRVSIEIPATGFQGGASLKVFACDVAITHTTILTAQTSIVLDSSYIIKEITIEPASEVEKVVTLDQSTVTEEVTFQ